MFTLDDKTQSVIKTAFVYLIITLFCAVIGAVYEKFSHEVYSYYMIYAFVIPLTLGAIPLFALGLFGKKTPCRFSLNAWNSGVAALTVGSIFKGALDIYGTTNRLLIVYPIVAGALLLAGIIAFFAGKSSE